MTPPSPRTISPVVLAFAALGAQAAEATAQQAQQMAPQEVMSSIGEALVATAVGIGVAIPAVAANNLFQRMTKATLANTDALSRVLLAHLKGEDKRPTGASVPPASPAKSEGRAEAPKAEASKKGSKKKAESEDDAEEKG